MRLIAKELMAVWMFSVTLSFVTLAIAISHEPEALEGASWYQAFSLVVQRHHGEGRCLLCGMTHSLCAVAHGNVAQGAALNAFGPAVFVVVCLNSVAGLVYLIRRANDLSLRCMRLPESVRLRESLEEGSTQKGAE